jgi:hypothetical protein
MANILKNKVRRLVNYDTSNFFSIMSKKIILVVSI